MTAGELKAMLKGIADTAEVKLEHVDTGETMGVVDSATTRGKDGRETAFILLTRNSQIEKPANPSPKRRHWDESLSHPGKPARPPQA